MKIQMDFSSGISCVFPKIDNTDKTFITLDTAGRDNPLLQNAIFEEENKNDKDKFIRKVARDQKVTEIVLNDFIIQESDVLITALEQLSFNEQEMLKTLINQIALSENKNSKENLKKNQTIKKRLIVIHNLMNITNANGINKFIEEVLLKSLTFSLTVQKIKKLNIYKQNLCQDKKPNIEIIHLIVGNDNYNDIKEKFNEPAFEFIRNNITTQVGKKFDILEQFKNFIIQNSNEFFEGEKMKEDSLIIGKEETKDGKIIILMKLSQENQEKEIKFKKFLINSKGVHIFSSSLEPKYSSKLIKIKDKEYIEIEFGLSGDVKNIDIYEPIIGKEQIIFIIKGKTNQKLNGENEFEFRPIINKYITVPEDGKFWGIFNKNSKEYEIKIENYKDFESNKDKYIKKNSEYGIYTIQIPIKREERITSLEENQGNNKE